MLIRSISLYSIVMNYLLFKPLSAGEVLKSNSNISLWFSTFFSLWIKYAAKIFQDLVRSKFSPSSVAFCCCFALTICYIFIDWLDQSKSSDHMQTGRTRWSRSISTVTGYWRLWALPCLFWAGIMSCFEMFLFSPAGVVSTLSLCFLNPAAIKHLQESFFFFFFQITIFQ